MVKPCRLIVISVAWMLGSASSASATARSDVDLSQTWRAAAAHKLAAHRDMPSLATAALLTYAGPATRSKGDTAKAASAAVPLAVKAGALAPDNAALSWLGLLLCANALACDVRDAATTMRWVDADNGAAWMPTLTIAIRDKDQMEIDRVLAHMAQGTRFDFYTNRLATLAFDALKRSRNELPASYLRTDVARLTEAMGIVEAQIVPSFSSLINVCREVGDAERHVSCLKLSKVLQRSDTIMAQLVGFAMERRLSLADGRDVRPISDHRRTLEWRVATSNEFDTPVLPWLKNARARARVKKMRMLAREEDVCIAILREHHFPTEPAEDR